MVFIQNGKSQKAENVSGSFGNGREQKELTWQTYCKEIRPYG